MRIIPAIDIINGECVRLTKGDYLSKKVYTKDILSVAKEYEKKGIRYLHVVDLDAAKNKELSNLSIVDTICSKTSLRVDYGGGISKESDLDRLFDIGVSQVNIGSLAVQNKDLFREWLSKYGPDKIILSADTLNGQLRTNAWTSQTKLNAISFIKQLEEDGLKYVVCTDIEKDGLLTGPSFMLYQEILAQTNVKLVASGGVSSISDLVKLDEQGCDGAIIGKAIYEDYLSIEELVELC